MSASLVKLALATGGLGVAGASGFGIYKIAFSDKTIKQVILDSDEKDDTYSFLSRDSKHWVQIKEEYAKEGARHKPIQNGIAIDKEKLPEWCSSAINSPFSEKEVDRYQSVLRWCYLNTNKFEEQMDLKGKKLAGEKEVSGGTVSQEWKNTWTKEYKSHKESAEWKITDGEENLNGNEEAAGATSLQKWCTKKLEVFFYAEGAKEDFRKFLRFCTKDKN
ncbi:hypothetical protein HF1_06510 [Mycoplasma haemofelis str. Langford 1]|uniref:Uncharacterized protein n=2 Tax=Mycoplasma haemofelis TaxID=29501 RepID=F6FIE6_MYCHI|nr:hypothetical protein [Mycoplasma haemofelis]AEG72994.1 hypothetical protein MHF_0724 [Mycoplasma haemofelis Ohio2]CBY92659.1 hypothetical protein HF1_06510 [Mycoplasma haemofelis str. Langford 1]